MTYKIHNEEGKSETPPPRNSERSKEPTAEDEDVVKDEKQVQKETCKNIPAPSSLYNICMFLHSQDKELEKLIKDLKCLGREEDGVIGRFEASCQLDYSNNPMLFQGTAMQDREANRKLLLEELRQLSAGFRQKQDEAFRRFKIWTPPISKFASDVKTANIKQPPDAEETMETSSSAETTKVAPVAFKEEISSCEEKETLNVPVPTENQLKCLDGSMEEEVVITTEGGLVEIQDTGVSLEIPPGALVKEQLIKMRIVSEDYHDDLAVSFGSNASVVVELLPSNLALLKPAKLTLPHCLVLKKGCEWKAKIYTSHHEKGNQPFWEEDPFASSELHQDYCEIWLQHFCWETFQVGNKLVEGKRIVLYAARSVPSPNSDAYVDVGFYLDLPGGHQAVDLKKEDILRKQHVVFYNNEELPLTILFKDLPSIWTCSPEEENPKQISVLSVANSKGRYSTFILKVQGNLEIIGCSCYFKAGQGTDLVDLKFPLEICLSSSESASDAKTANIKQPPAAEETMETSSSAETTTIWRPPNAKFSSDVETDNIKQPPAAEETMETSSSAETTTVPNDLCSAHLSISRGEPQKTSGPASDYTVSSTCPECINILQYVALHIADKWKDLGRHLGVKEPHLTIIKANDNNDCKEQSVQMLMKWIEEYGSGAKYMVLGKALKDAGRLDLQQYVLAQLKLQE